MSRSIFAPDPTPDSGFRLTGRHVLIIFIAFFGVVFAVNAVMMRAALTTFSGLEAENPYKEGLAFNRRLADSRAQELRAWSVDASVTRAADGQVAVAVAARDATGGLGGLTGIVRFEWPADRRRDHVAVLADIGGGQYRGGVEALPPGQWDVVVEFRRDDTVMFLSRTRKILR